MKVVFSLIEPFLIPARQFRYPYEWFYSDLWEYLTI